MNHIRISLLEQEDLDPRTEIVVRRNDIVVAEHLRSVTQQSSRMRQGTQQRVTAMLSLYGAAEAK